MKKTLLIVEDEDDVRHGLKSIFETEGYIVHEATNGPEAIASMQTDSADLVLLDLMIPELDGFGVCRKIRALGLTTPILILTARSSEVDKVLGLELGADDYVTKPFGVAELIARVRAMLRRSDGMLDGRTRVQLGSCAIDLQRCQAERGGHTYELFHYEVGILKYLWQKPGEVVSRQDLLNAVWGIDAFPTTRTVDYHVCNLRKKVEEEPSDPQHILTVHGIGYRLLR